MKPKFIHAITLLHLVSFGTKVMVKGQCKNGDFCNIADCTKRPPAYIDEDELDRACASYKCAFRYYWDTRNGYSFSRQCVDPNPNACNEGEFCNPGSCFTLRDNFNQHCKPGLNCDRNSRCAKKPKCKDGDYCHRYDCKAQPRAGTKPEESHDECESNVCGSNLKCEEEEYEYPMDPEDEDNKNVDGVSVPWWVWVFIFPNALFQLLILACLVWCCYSRKSNKVADAEQGRKKSSQEKLKRKKSSEGSEKNKKSEN